MFSQGLVQQLTMEYGSECTVKFPTYGKISKRCLTKLSPEKLTISGNFTQAHRLFDISSPVRRNSTRQDILDTVMRRTESIMLERDSEGNPTYEDPKDIVGDKPVKPPRKRTIQGIAVTSPRPTKEGRSLLREQKRKLSKKYEGLITALMDKCEENINVISEKESQISKLKEKLKTVLEYNKLFANENDRLKADHTTLLKYAEECKVVIREERERNAELEGRCKKLEERVNQFDGSHKANTEPLTAIPLVEVCMSCSSRQIVLNQAREQNARLQKDMQALKDVLYRLNVQLSRYQERIRNSVPTLTTDGKEACKPSEKYDGFDSLITASLGHRQEAGQMEESLTHKSGTEEEGHTGRVVDLSGLLSAQALAPLFDAYQENLQEKDNLILDYEKQFENINKKSKQILIDNKSLADRVNAMEAELVDVRQSYKKLVVEKETGDIERATLLERSERAESKLKEVYELYEDKMGAMMRDYETVHREYFSVKGALEASTGKLAHLAARTVPADLHERRLDHCKRLLEELKHQYGMESERKSEQLKKLQDECRTLEGKYEKICQEYNAAKEELRAALKNVKLYRRAAVVFRQRARAAAARATRARRSTKRSKHAHEPLRRALDALDRIKHEIKAVKSRAYTSLEELERRIVEQERRAAAAQAEYRRELERASLALDHKEGIIRSLIDKVADIEEVRLSQTNTHRLQGIISDSSPDHSVSPKNNERKESKTVKLVPTSGGYYQDKEDKSKRKK